VRSLSDLDKLEIEWKRQSPAEQAQSEEDLGLCARLVDGVYRRIRDPAKFGDALTGWALQSITDIKVLGQPAEIQGREFRRRLPGLAAMFEKLMRTGG
jgi:hypothetical protein